MSGADDAADVGDTMPAEEEHDRAAAPAATARPDPSPAPTADRVANAVSGVAAAAAAGGFETPPHVRFWREMNKEFSTWFLLLPEEKRRAVVEEAGGPEFPERGPGQGGVMKPTDLLLPELTKAGMLAGGGRCLILFFTRRAVETCTETDTKMLQTLYDKKMLPRLGGEQLDKFKLAAIDPRTENVIGVPHSCTAAQLAEVEALLKAGSLLHADVYLARKLRQTSIATFLDALITIFHRDAKLA